MSNRILKRLPILYLVKSGHTVIDDTLYQGLTNAGVAAMFYNDLEDSLSHLMDAMKRQKVVAICYPVERKDNVRLSLQYCLKTSTNPLTTHQTDPIHEYIAEPLLPGVSDTPFHPPHVEYIVKRIIDITNTHWVKTADYQQELRTNAA